MTQVLPPVFCIFVRDLEERRAAFLREATTLGINVILWEGLFGKRSGISAGYKRGGDMSSGHATLCINHWFLWQHALLAGHEWIVVCEDDATLPEDFRELTCRVIEEVTPAGINLVYLGWLDGFRRPTAKITSLCSKMLRGIPYGTHCLLIHRSALNVLMRTNLEVNSHIDISIGARSLPHLQWAVCDPPIVRQKSCEGDWDTSL